MVILRRGLFTQASPTRPLLSTFEELLVEEEQAKEAALMEAIKAAHEKVNDAKAGKRVRRKKLPRRPRLMPRKPRKRQLSGRRPTRKLP